MAAVEGMVDLQTLGKIFEVLVTSQDSEDQDLATWIKENYLPVDFDGLVEQGVAINDTEGFAKLYNAYKRVRNLTNRAQDKWPFFDRRWKSLTSSQVTKMATSEGTLSSEDSTGLHKDSSVARISTEEDPAASKVQTRASSLSTSLKQTAKEQPAARGSPEPDVSQKQNTLAKQVERLPTPISPIMDSPEEKPDGNEDNTQASMGLAVESASEHTILDNLPTSLDKKRKLDSNDNGRSSRAKSRASKAGHAKPSRGRGGRPRKSAPPPRAVLDDALNDHTPSTFQGMILQSGSDPAVAESPFKKQKTSAASPRVTRRQTRLFAGNEASTTDIQMQSARQGSEETIPPRDRGAMDSQRLIADQAEGIVVSGHHSDPATDESGASVISNDFFFTGSPMQGKKVGAGSSAQGDGMKATDSQTSMASSNKASVAGQELKLQDVGRVQYFARVATAAGFIEVPIDDAIAHDEKLKRDLLGYAAWCEKAGDKSSNVSFDTWLSILSSGR